MRTVPGAGYVLTPCLRLYFIPKDGVPYFSRARGSTCNLFFCEARAHFGWQSLATPVAASLPRGALLGILSGFSFDCSWFIVVSSYMPGLCITLKPNSLQFWCLHHCSNAIGVGMSPPAQRLPVLIALAAALEGTLNFL